MASQPGVTPAAGRVSFNWIIDRNNDLAWYIGSALAGWLYVAVILTAVALLPRPLEDALGVIRLGGIQIPLTLHLLVYGTWAFLLDAPHLFSTLARTFFDTEERRVRRRELWLSWAWFFLGPAVILAPYAVTWLLRPTGIGLPPGGLTLGALAFVVFFRLWAYSHVVRQHWGFLALYRRKNGESDPAGLRVDAWFFNLSFYLPLVMFLTGSVYARTPGFPPLGLDSLRLGSFSISGAIHGLAWLTLLGAAACYAGYQVRRWAAGGTINGPKLLLLALLVPLHLAAFSNPWLTALLVPIVTVGHNIQYHRIVWMYGRNKYLRPERAAGFRTARLIFGRAWAYLGMGLLFTVALYRGPWIDWVQATFGMALDRSFLHGIGMMAGLQDPAELNLGQQVFGAVLLGWAMQHYYLDARIWRFSRDRTVAEQLRVETR